MSISLLSFSECMLTLYFNRFLYLKIKLFDLRLNFNFFSSNHYQKKTVPVQISKSKSDLTLIEINVICEVQGLKLRLSGTFNSANVYQSAACFRHSLK